MSEDRLTIEDYPLAEKRPEIVRGKRGKGLDEITWQSKDRTLDGKPLSDVNEIKMKRLP